MGRADERGIMFLSSGTEGIYRSMEGDVISESQQLSCRSLSSSCSFIFKYT